MLHGCFKLPCTNLFLTKITLEFCGGDIYLAGERIHSTNQRSSWLVSNFTVVNPEKACIKFIDKIPDECFIVHVPQFNYVVTQVDHLLDYPIIDAV